MSCFSMYMNRGTETQTIGNSTVYVGYEDAKNFNLADGISFDYFFDSGSVSLSTFYVQCKLSFWIMIIAAALIIKTLMTAIWGVIKRFYEITLYFLAMPAVASTIPLDNGSKFNSSIQQPLVKKVLSTYGVILGLNVFFVLLTPIQSLSKVFTAEDIATSGTYFLTYLSKLTSFSFTASLLNDYVYILFVLVAFTLIDTLPGVISGLIGADDIKASGQQTKQQVTESLSSAGNIVSGKAALDAAGGAIKTAANFIPGKELIARPINKIKGGVDHAIESFGRGFAEGYGKTGGGNKNGIEGGENKRENGEEDKENENPENKPENPGGGPTGGGGPDSGPEGGGENPTEGAEGVSVPGIAGAIVKKGAEVAKKTVNKAGGAVYDIGDKIEQATNSLQGSQEGQEAATTVLDEAISYQMGPNAAYTYYAQGLTQEGAPAEQKTEEEEEGETGARIADYGDDDNYGDTDEITNKAAEAAENAAQTEVAETAETENAETKKEAETPVEPTTKDGEVNEETDKETNEENNEENETTTENAEATEEAVSEAAEKKPGVFSKALSLAGGRLKTGVFDLGQRFKKVGGSVLEMVGLKDAFSLRDKNGNKRSMLGFIAGMPLRAAAGVIKAIPNLPRNALNVVKDVGHLAKGLDVMHVVTKYEEGTKTKYGEEGTRTGLSMGVELVGKGANYVGSKIANSKIGDGASYLFNTAKRFVKVGSAVKDLLLAPAEGFGGEVKTRAGKVKEAWGTFREGNKEQRGVINEKWAGERQEKRRGKINKALRKNNQAERQAEETANKAAATLAAINEDGFKGVNKDGKITDQEKLSASAEKRRQALEAQVKSGQTLSDQEKQEYDNIVLYQQARAKQEFIRQDNERLNAQSEANEAGETDIGKIRLRSGKNHYLTAQGVKHVNQGADVLEQNGIQVRGKGDQGALSVDEIRAAVQEKLSDDSVDEQTKEKLKTALQNVEVGVREQELGGKIESAAAARVGSTADTRSAKKGEALRKRRANAVAAKETAETTKQRETEAAEAANQAADEEENKLLEKMQGYYVLDENGESVSVGDENYSGHERFGASYERVTTELDVLGKKEVLTEEEQQIKTQLEKEKGELEHSIKSDRARQAADAEIVRLESKISNGTATDEDKKKHTTLRSMLTSIDKKRADAENHANNAQEQDIIAQQQQEIIEDTDVKLKANAQKQAKRMRKTTVFGGNGEKSADELADETISGLKGKSEAERIKTKATAQDNAADAANQIRTQLGEVETEKLAEMGLSKGEDGKLRKQKTDKDGNVVKDEQGNAVYEETEVSDADLVELVRGNVEQTRADYKAGKTVDSKLLSMVGSVDDYDANKRVEKKIGTTRKDRYQAANEEISAAEGNIKKISEGLAHEMGEKGGRYADKGGEALIAQLERDIADDNFSENRGYLQAELNKAKAEQARIDKANQAKAKVDAESDAEYTRQQRIKKAEGNRTYDGTKFANRTQESNNNSVDAFETEKEASVKSIENVFEKQRGEDDKDFIERARLRRNSLNAKQQRGEELNEEEQKQFDVLDKEVRVYDLAQAKQTVASRVIKRQAQKDKGSSTDFVIEDWDSLTPEEKQQRIVKQEREKSEALGSLRNQGFEGTYSEIVESATKRRDSLYKQYTKSGNKEDFDEARKIDEQLKKYNNADRTARDIRERFAGDVTYDKGQVGERATSGWNDTMGTGERAKKLAGQYAGAHGAAAEAARIMGGEANKEYTDKYAAEQEKIDAATRRISKTKQDLGFDGDDRAYEKYLEAKFKGANTDEDRDKYQGLLEGFRKDKKILSDSLSAQEKLDSDMISAAKKESKSIKKDYVEGKASGFEFTRAQKLTDQIQAYNNANATAKYMQRDMARLDRRDMRKKEGIDGLRTVLTKEETSGKTDEQVVQKAYEKLGDKGLSDKQKSDIRAYLSKYIEGGKIVASGEDGQFARQVSSVHKTVEEYESRIDEAKKKKESIVADNSSLDKQRIKAGEGLENILGLEGKEASADQIINLAMQKQAMLSKKGEVDEKLNQYLSDYQNAQIAIARNKTKSANLDNQIDTYYRCIKQASAGITGGPVSVRSVGRDVNRRIAEEKGEVYGIKGGISRALQSVRETAKPVMEHVAEAVGPKIAETARRVKDAYGDFRTKPLTQEQIAARKQKLEELKSGKGVEGFSQLGISGHERDEARQSAKKDDGIGLSRVFTYRGHKADAMQVQGYRRDLDAWRTQEAEVTRRLEQSTQERSGITGKAPALDKKISELKALQSEVQSKIAQKETELSRKLSEMAKKQLAILPKQTPKAPVAGAQSTQGTATNDSGKPVAQQAPAGKQPTQPVVRTTQAPTDITVAEGITQYQNVTPTEKQVKDLVAGTPISVDKLSRDQIRKIVNEAMEDPKIFDKALQRAYRKLNIDPKTGNKDQVSRQMLRRCVEEVIREQRFAPSTMALERRRENLIIEQLMTRLKATGQTTLLGPDQTRQVEQILRNLERGGKVAKAASKELTKLVLEAEKSNEQIRKNLSRFKGKKQAS